MRRIVTLLMLVAWAGQLTAAETPEAAFDKAYGTEFAKAMAGKPKDAAALAQQLLKAAVTLSEAPNNQEMISLLSAKIVQLGLRDPSGYAAALNATDLALARGTGKTRPTLEDRLTVAKKVYDSAATPAARKEAAATIADTGRDLLAVLEQARDYPAGEQVAKDIAAYLGQLDGAVKAEIKQLQERFAAARTAGARLKELVEKSKTDASVKPTIVWMYLVEMDDPYYASKYLPAGDDATAKRVAAADKDAKDLSEAETMELADWYAAQEEKASAAGRRVVYARAAGYYAAFLDKHAEKDLPRTKAELALMKFAAATQPSAVRAASRGWEDVLKKWQAQTKAGTPDAKLPDGVKFDGGLLVLGGVENPKVGLADGVDGSFELEVEFERTAGRDSFGVIFPLGKVQAAVVLGGFAGEKEVGGIAGADGKEFNQGDTTTPVAIATAKRYKLSVLVEKTAAVADKAPARLRIAVRLNDQDFVSWSGKADQVASDKYWFLDPPRIGLSCWSCTYKVYSVKMRRLG